MRMFGLVVAAVAVCDVVVSTKPKPISAVDMQLRTELLQSVRDVLGNRIPDGVQTRIGDITRAFAPTLDTVNKNSNGNLDDDEVNYVLQRFFSQHHGWTFAPFGQGSLAVVHDMFKLKRKDGIAARDVAMMAAVIEHTVERSNVADVSMVEQHHEGCMSKEGVLFDMEEGQSGRVTLSDFYHIALHEQDTLAPDSVQTLRANGALDESDASTMKMIIPNYMASPSNCIPHSSFFSICCPNGCLDILSHIETALGQNHATTDDLVSAIESSPMQLTGLADGFVPRQLVQKLRDIAALNRGHVHLHGDAFAQWLHAVSPQTCALPQRGNIMQSKDTSAAHRAIVNDKLALEEELFEGELFVTRKGNKRETADDMSIAAEMLCCIIAVAFVVVLARNAVVPSKSKKMA